MNKRNTILLFIFIILMICIPDTTQAQCAMCKLTAETNMQNGGNAGRGLNAGILYMLSLPYLLVGVIGYVWWKKRKKEVQ